MSCALLLTLIWGLYHESLAQYCVDQPHGQEYFAGESITIPCTFTYLESISPESVNFVVKASDHPRFCGGIDKMIYNSSISHGNRNKIFDQYAGRLSGQYDLRARTSSFTIKNLTKKDEKLYCCRFIINIINHKNIEWQHPEGTRITVKEEKEMILNQEHFMLALPGDIVTMIARFIFKNRTLSHNITKCDVFWSGDKDCGSRKYSAACTQRINENIVSVTVNNSDKSKGFYCYSINVLVEGTNYTGQTKTGTELLILKPSGASNINQTMEVEVKGSVIINCSFSIQDMLSSINVGNRSVLWTQVYWMVGEPREHFVYHPNEDYIHLDYKGKTKLIGRYNLLLEDFHGLDNTTLYCRVAVRYCSPTTEPPSPVHTILQEGPGTVLRVRETTQSIPEASISLVQTIIIASCVGCAVILFLVLLIVCWKARKDIKMSDTGEIIVASIDLSMNQNSAYENIQGIQRKATETDDKMVKPSAARTAKKPPVSEESEDDKMVYAVVKLSATTTAKKPPVSEESEVVYTAVKKR